MRICGRSMVGAFWKRHDTVLPVGDQAMSFQLLNIAVYNARGDRREITFHPGMVNIVTGGSRTGKTALIYIVDYCLGRTECTVPAGIIRDSVAWYVVRIQAPGTQIIIGRPPPPDGQQTTT